MKTMGDAPDPEGDPDEPTPVEDAEHTCRYCNRHIIPAADAGRGWRHADNLFISCHPARFDTELAEP